MTTYAPAPGRSRLDVLLRRGTVPLLLSLAGGLLAGFALNQVLNRAIAGRTEASAFALLARVGPELETVLGSGQSAKEAINRLGRQLSLRATLVGTDGRVLGDSSVDPERVDALENHASRPEVLDARRTGSGVRTRYSSTVGERLVYAAVRLRGGEVLRLAFPEKDLARWEAPFRAQTLGLSVLASLLVAALLILARSRHAAELDLVRQALGSVERLERPADPGRVSEEAAILFSALGDLADDASERDASVRRAAASPGSSSTRFRPASSSSIPRSPSSAPTPRRSAFSAPAPPRSAPESTSSSSSGRRWWPVCSRRLWRRAGLRRC
ncbi:MAG: hypothetical protein IPN03_20190 [Holophagales bacterium]|nr:hypothetical protein [Holophagales bacterium]